MDVLYIIYDSTYFKSNEIDTIESCTYGSTLAQIIHVQKLTDTKF